MSSTYCFVPNALGWWTIIPIWPCTSWTKIYRSRNEWSDCEVPKSKVINVGNTTVRLKKKQSGFGVSDHDQHRSITCFQRIQSPSLNMTYAAFYDVVWNNREYLWGFDRLHDRENAVEKTEIRKKIKLLCYDCVGLFSSAAIGSQAAFCNGARTLSLIVLQHLHYDLHGQVR